MLLFYKFRFIIIKPNKLNLKMKTKNKGKV